MLEKCCKKYGEYSTLFVRLAVGIVFLVHGVGKLFGVGPVPFPVSNFTGMLANLGVPAPMAMAWAVSLLEAVGGLLVLVGLFTRYAAALHAINRAAAILLVHLSKGFSAMNGGYEFPLVLLLVSLALVASGSGEKLVLERLLFKKEL